MKNKGKTKKTRIVATEKGGNFLSWFELPVADLDRAIAFYSSLLGLSFEVLHTDTHTMAFFPEQSGFGGALVYGDGCIPTPTGTLLYLNVGSDLDAALAKVETYGGHIQMGKTLISEEVGSYSLILDSEGNRIALFSKAS